MNDGCHVATGVMATKLARGVEGQGRGGLPRGNNSQEVSITIAYDGERLSVVRVVRLRKGPSAAMLPRGNWTNIEKIGVHG